jgi:hypothetical protein
MKRKAVVLSVCAGLIVIAIIVGLLSFHIVIRRNLPLIVAKDSMTFKRTFVTLKGYTREYAEAPVDKQIELERSGLHRALVRKGLIRKVTRPVSPSKWRF